MNHSLAAILLSLAIAPATFAQQQATTTPKEPVKPSDVLIDRPDAAPDLGSENGNPLGPVYESKGHGISFSTPKGSVAVRRLGVKEFIEFVDESRGWSLKASKVVLNKPGSLTAVRDTRGNLEPGLLEFTAKRLKEELPDAVFLRQEVVNIGDGDVGILALRYTKNLKPMLSQQAIIQKTDQLYYLLSLTTPGALKNAKDADAATSERLAVETFRQVLDSVKLLDLRGVKEDQDARLIRTRALFVNWTPDRIRSVLARERWTRILKNGKDIGYSYFEETTTVKGSQEGVEIHVRSRVLPGQDVQVDSGTIMFSSMDLRHEDWSTLTNQADVKRLGNKDYKPPQLTEYGISDRRSTPGQRDVYAFQVTYESTAGKVDPVARDLSPFYISQAMSQLLPRLVPLREPKTFMFAVYVPETREVMARYVDVLASKKLEFNHQVVRAVPVEDRLGLEGPLTTHYLTSEGTWLGSETKDSGITVIPSDEETLMKLWKDANLTAPDVPGARRDAGQAVTNDAQADSPKPAQAANPDSSRKAARQKLGIGSGTK